MFVKARTGSICGISFVLVDF